MSNLIKLIYSLNNEESSVAFDSGNKIANLKTLINLTQKIDLDEYEVFYRKKEIKWSDETPIREFIGKEKVPIFYIKLKVTKTIQHSTEKKVDNTKNQKDTDIKANEEKKTDKSHDSKPDNKLSNENDEKKSDIKSPQSKAEVKNKDEKKLDIKSQQSKEEVKNKDEKKLDIKSQQSKEEIKNKDERMSNKRPQQSKEEVKNKDEKKSDVKSQQSKEEVNNKDEKKSDQKIKEDKSNKDIEKRVDTTTKTDLESDNPKKNELVNFKCKVIVENFPSRPEFFEIIEKFEEDKQAKNLMTLISTSSGVQITFKNPDLAYEFLKHINIEKANNPLYSKVLTNLVLDAKKVVKVDRKRSAKKLFNTETKNENSLNVSQISPLLDNEQNSRFFKHNNHLSKSQNYKELAIWEHFNKLKDENLKHKLLKKRYKNANFVSLASPYMSEEDRYRKENLEKKKKWFDKKGFIIAVQKNSPIKPIPNFVNLDHYGESAINHQFRDDFKTKSKWMDKTGRNFLV